MVAEEKKYRITLEDNFHATAELFVKDIGASKAAFSQFKKSLSRSATSSATFKESLKGVSRTIGGISRSTTTYANAIVAQNAAIADRKRLNRTYFNNLRKDAGLQKSAATAARNRATAIRAANKLMANTKFSKDVAAEYEKSNAALNVQRQHIRANTQQTRLWNRELTRTVSHLQKIAAIRGLKGIVGSARGGGGGGGKKTGAAAPGGAFSRFFSGEDNPLAGAVARLTSIEQRANRISFTFRRLFGILAGFLIVRRAGQAFLGLIRTAIQFNDTIEKSTLGIATLVVSSFQLRDSFGAAVDPAQQLVLAQTEARKQMSLLRQDSLKTAATFEQLLDAFQVSVAPGAVAGLDLNQIRQTTVLISQAASALGLEQNQLAEEIRSLLQGTISVRTTRVATALGISNEDIKQAKEAGVLFEFLTDKFKAFKSAQELSLNLFSVILTNLKQATSLVLGTGLNDFFVDVKNALIEIQELLLNEDPLTGLLVPDDDVVGILQEVSSVLETSVRLAKNFSENLDRAEVLSLVSSAAKVLNILLAEAADAALLIFKSFTTTSAIINEVALKIKGVVQDVKNIFPDPERFSQLLGIFAAISSILFVITTSWHAFLFILTPIIGGISVIRVLLVKAWGAIVLMSKAFVAIKTAIVATTFPVIAVVLGIAAMAAWLTIALLKTNALGVKFETILIFIRDGVPAAFKAAFAIVKIAAYNLADLLIEQFIKPFQKMNDLALDMLKRQKKFVSLFSIGLSTKFNQAIDVANTINEILETPSKTLEGKILEATDDLNAALGSLETSVFQAVLGNADNRTLEQLYNDTITGIANAVENSINTALEKMRQNFIDSAGEVKLLSDVLAGIPAVITLSDGAFKDQVAAVEKLREGVVDARRDLETFRSIRGLEGPVADSIEAIKKAQFKFEDASLKLHADLAVADQVRLGLQTRLRVLQEEITAGNATEAVAISAIVDLERERIAAAAKLSELNDKATIAEERRKKLKASGDTSGTAIAAEEVKNLKNAIDAQEKFIKGNIDRINILRDGLVFSEEAQKRITELAHELVVTTGLEAGAAANVNKIREKLIEIQTAISNELDITLQKHIEIGAELDRQRQAERSDNQRDLNLDKKLRNLRKVEGGGGDILDSAVQSIQASGELENLKIQEARVLQVQAARRKELETKIEGLEVDKAIARSADEEAKAVISLGEAKAVLLALNKRQSEEAAELTLEIQKQSDLIDSLSAKGKSIIDGNTLTAAFQDIQERIGTVEERALVAASTIANAFSNAFIDSIEGTAEILADSLLDALDPTSESKSIRERFSTLFKSIGSDLLKEIFKQQILKGFAALLGGIGGGAAPAGGYRGGLVPEENGIPTIAHFGPKAKAYHKGGAPNARDTVPAWLEPGEYIQTKASVRKYGSDFMEAVRSLAIDPVSARSLLNGVKVRRHARRSGRVAFATGGQVTRATNKNTASVSVSSGPTRVVMVPDEESYERMQAQGNRPFMKAIQENANEIGSLLRNDRGQDG